MRRKRGTPHRSGFSSRAPATAAALILTVLVATSFLAPIASADFELATSHGSGSGQTEKPRAIAVDRSNGNVFVADTGNNRIDVFEADGDFVRAFGWGVADGTTTALQVCTTTCFKGIEGSGAGQFSSADLGRSSIAVDNDPASSSFHDVFVGSSRVQRFNPNGSFVSSFNAGTSGLMAVGPSGDVYVADTPNHLRRFSSSGVLLADLTLLPAGLGGLSGLTVDSAGNFYLTSGEEAGAVRKYDLTGTLLNTLNPSFNLQALATDATDNLLVSDLSGVDHIAQYSSVGTQLRVIYGSAERRLISLASYSSVTGDFFGLEDFESVSAPNRIVHIPVPPPGPVVLPFSGFTATGTTATTISNTKATINAQVNPEGKATTFRVEYVDEETYDDEGFTSALKTPELAVGSDFALHKVSTEIGCTNPATEAGKPGSKCLLPETTYHYRVVATNPDGTSTGPEGEPFATKPPLEITAVFATDVVTSSAVLHGEVNPLGIPATGYFQYVDEKTCEEDLKAFGPGHCFDHATEIPAPTEPIDFGAGEAPEHAAAQLTSLIPATTYRYRLVATNAFTTQTSSEQVIHTYAPPSPPKTDCANQAFRTAASAALPDCRAYELVSPVDKAGGDIAPLLDANLEQAARDGESITYSSYRAFADSTSAPFTSQYLARRSNTGWQSESIASPREGASFYGGEYRTANQYKLFSENLCSAWLTTETEPLLAPQAVPGFPNVYRRQNCGSEAGSYEALTTAKAKEAEPKQIDPKPQAFSADGSLTVFTVEGKLTPDGVLCAKAGGDFCTRQAYLSQAGKLRLLCILPDGTPSEDSCAAGFIRAPSGTVGQRSDDAYHAVSDDGSRVFWTEGLGGSPLHVRVNPNQGQSKVEAGKCTEAAKACTLAVSVTNAHFRTAAGDGSTVIYTEGEFNGALHQFDVDAALAGEPEPNTEIAGNALSMLGASEDASRVYFVSPEVLSEEPNSEGDKAQAGKPNLYLHEASEGGGAGSFAFIGALSGSDQAASVQSSPGLRRSRVTPDGSHLAFVSAAPLTGYDNRDAASGEANDEVYLYDAEEAELRCISCNPSGGRPVGTDLSQGIGAPTAARIPAWLNGVHFSGILSEDGGRLFFESVDPLVLRDTNGAIDVYEWQQAAGESECEEAGADLFSPGASGCISLISSGKSPEDSQLVDASTDGEDVFFMTQSSLLPQDTGLIDIYDARVEGGFPQPPAPPAACEGEACQGTPAAPNDPTPASSAFEGAGNVIEQAKPSCRKGTRAVRKAGKTRCVKRKAKSKRNDRTNSNRRTTR